MPDKRNEQPPRRFPGFQSPNYTPVPDELFDELLPELSGAELKVLLYIIRRTFGFKKDSDNISLAQMLSGIKTRDGEIIDRGTGIKDKKTLLAAIRSLEERGFITTERRRSMDRGDEPSTYRLNVLYSSTSGKIPPPVGGKSHQGGGGEIPPGPWGKNPPTQETVLQETVKQNIYDSNDRKTEKGKEHYVNNDNYRQSEAGDPPQAVMGEMGQSRADGQGEPEEDESPSNHRNQTTRNTSNNPAAREINHNTATVSASGDPDGFQSVASMLNWQKNQQNGADEEARAMIFGFIHDLAAELNDQAPLSSSTTRAYNLLTRSRLSPDAFAEQMYRARRTTQERSAAIAKTVKDKRTGYPRKAKMAYFFSVLEQQLGFRDAPEQSHLPEQ